jgi:hypothetical protein
MMLHVIPLTSDSPHYEQQTELDGVVYALTLEWNEREGAWYLTLADANGDIIRAGIKLVTNWRLLRRVRDARRPPGELVAYDPAGKGLGRDNLGTDVQLLYADAELIAEMTGG